MMDEMTCRVNKEEGGGDMIEWNRPSCDIMSLGDNRVFRVLYLIGFIFYLLRGKGEGMVGEALMP